MSNEIYFAHETNIGQAIFVQESSPPSYDEAINTNGPPPTYDSLFGKVRKAQRSSRGVQDFLKNIFIIVLGTLGITIILGVTVVIPVCMITIGIVYIHDCPQGEYIPVYLIVGGLFGILKQLLHLSARVRHTDEERREENLKQSPTQTLLNCFMLGWFIIGSVWIYKEYQPNYNQSLGIYCNKTLYLFAFWLVTSVYIVLGIVTIYLCSISIVTLIFHKDGSDEFERNQSP
ncbi:hypothetical protein WA026_019160 [Henosepilachna vigintioctopunctata]|uniref:Transmembrane protein 272-like n=1 Tax=Henosepilachna vigintioctopunctata TaxID=420089 RepID=A0AAW1V0M9_9CUCU